MNFKSRLDWFLIILCSFNYGYCSCPFMEHEIKMAKLQQQLQNEIKKEFYTDDLMIESGQPGGSTLWINIKLTKNHKEILDNATIGLIAGQLYNQRKLMTNSGPILSQNTRMSMIRSESHCVPKEYRCRVLDKTCDFNALYQTIDGTCNNPKRPALGATFTPYGRFIDAVFYDGLYKVRRSKLTNEPLKSAREIGNILYSKSGYNRQPNKISNIGGLFFGQYIAHDLSLLYFQPINNGGSGMRCCSADYTERLANNIMDYGCLPIDISSDDEYYSQYNMTCMELIRTAPMFPRNCQLGVAEPGMYVTSYLDKSVLYGYSDELSKRLRSGIDGMLKTNHFGNFPEYPNCEYNDWRCFMMGNVPQTVMLLTVTLLNLHYHNYLAKELKMINPHWNDDKLFQEARRIFIAINQHLTYDEWFPLYVGSKSLLKAAHEESCNDTSPYTDYYDPKVDISTMAEFAHGAIRLCHQLAPANFSFYENSETIYKTLPLRELIFETSMLNTDYLGALKGTLYQAVNVLDSYSNDIRTRAFSNYNEKGIGVDVSALDIQRGRDVGLAPYYQYMELCNGSVKVLEWSDLEPNIPAEHIMKLKLAYKCVHDVDLITGIFFEHKDNYMGPVARCIVAEQFIRKRSGDRYFYSNKNRPNPFTEDQINEINNFTYAKMVCANGQIDSVPKNALEILSDSNPEVSCSSIQPMNLLLWKE